MSDQVTDAQLAEIARRWSRDGWLINDAGEPSAFQCDHHRRTA